MICLYSITKFIKKEKRNRNYFRRRHLMVNMRYRLKNYKTRLKPFAFPEFSVHCKSLRIYSSA